MFIEHTDWLPEIIVVSLSYNTSDEIFHQASSHIRDLQKLLLLE